MVLQLPKKRKIPEHDLHTKECAKYFASLDDETSWQRNYVNKSLLCRMKGKVCTN